MPNLSRLRGALLRTPCLWGSSPGCVLSWSLVVWSRACGFCLFGCCLVGVWRVGSLFACTHVFTPCPYPQALTDVHASVTTASEGKVADLVGKMREKIVLRRAAALVADEGGIVSAYVHNSLGPGCGTVAALVSLASSSGQDLRGDAATSEELSQLGKKLAMHAVAAKPKFLSRKDVSAGDLEREKAVQERKAREAGKPEEIIAKMVGLAPTQPCRAVVRNDGHSDGCARLSLPTTFLALLCSVLCALLSSPFLSSPLLSSPFLSFPLLSSPFLSFPLLSSPFLSVPFLSFPFLSFPFLSSPNSPALPSTRSWVG